MKIYKTYRVMVHPNNKQKTKMFKYANACRYAYNWALEQEKKAYENKENFILAFNLNYIFVKYKNQEGNEWLKNANAEAMNTAIADAVIAYKRFFDGTSSFPKFKSKKHTRPSFYQPTNKIKITETHVSIQGLAGTKRRSRLKINFVKFAEKNKIPTNVKYHNPKFSYDGLNWWFSVSIEEPDSEDVPTGKGIGIDLGLKDLAIVSNGKTYPNINRDDNIKKTKKKLKRIQRQISRKYLMNKDGDKFRKTKNIIKAEQKAIKLSHRLSNIRLNNIHHITTELVRTKPEYVVMEDLNVRGLMKNRHLARAIAEQLWGEFYRQMKYKSEWNNINFITADKWFPSSKLCSVCGIINKGLKLSDRTFICLECGNEIDRDLQAAINLANYPKSTKAA